MNGVERKGLKVSKISKYKDEIQCSRRLLSKKHKERHTKK
jgi:hypothetical protein